MFQLNLLLKKIKNILSIFKKDNLEYLLINNFKQVFIFFSLLGVIIVIVSIAFMTCNKKNNNSSIQNTITNNNSNTRKNTDMIIPDAHQKKQLHLLLDSEFIYPSIRTFDISTDYIEFQNMIKGNVIPQINFEDFSKYFEQIEDESLLFNIEKRNKK